MAQSSKQTQLYVYLGIALVGLVVAGGALFLGMRDDGAINVNAEIQNANQQAAETVEEGGEAKKVPAPNQNQFSSEPNGGLVASGKETEPEPESQPEPKTAGAASSTATSTDERATSTEDGGGAPGTSADSETSATTTGTEAATTTEG